jgi:signal transduction histidine kinase
MGMDRIDGRFIGKEPLGRRFEPNERDAPIESTSLTGRRDKAGLTASFQHPAMFFRRVRPERSVRLRLTLLYGGLFGLSAAVLFFLTVLLRARFWGFNNLHNPLVRFSPEIAFVIMVIVSIWLGWLMAGRVLGPLRTITAAARQISEENLHQRLALEGPDDELKDLGDTFDELLGRLESAFDAQRTFVSNASHELRTPLAMMRTSLDVAARKSPPVSRDATVLVGKVREGLDQADRLVESFLVLARAQRGVITDFTTVSLPTVVSSALDRSSSALTDQDLTVR